MAPTFFFILPVLVSTIVTSTCTGKTISKFPAILIFGDSTVDTGNNNYINTLFKGNHRPYGQDFPGHIPTGRFSNGELVPDLLASMLGIKEMVPPFLQPNLSDYELRTGVSFASAGSGYDDLTSTFSGVIPMSKQPGYLKDYKDRLRMIVGEEEALRIVSSALVVVCSGTNDFIFNFYDSPTRRIQLNINQYQDFLQNRLQNFVKELYDLGCRIIVVTGLPPIGCLPLQIATKLKGLILRSCLQDQNSDAQVYNDKLVKLLPQIQAYLRGSRIFYADIYEPLLDMIKKPQKYGFVETIRGCCGTGIVEAGPFCTSITPVCANPSQHLFFDSIHPGKSAYRYVTEYLQKEILPALSQIHGR